MPRSTARPWPPPSSQGPRAAPAVRRAIGTTVGGHTSDAHQRRDGAKHKELNAVPKCPEARPARGLRQVVRDRVQPPPYAGQLVPQSGGTRPTPTSAEMAPSTKSSTPCLNAQKHGPPVASAK